MFEKGTKKEERACILAMARLATEPITYYESQKASNVDFSIRWHVLKFFMYDFLEGPMHFIFPSSDFCKYDSVPEYVLSSIN